MNVALNKARFALLVVASLVAVPYLMQSLLAENTGTADRSAQQLRTLDWESLGFSADGQFFASITYGSVHDPNREESHFFARLQVLSLWNQKLVLERVLRRKLSLQVHVPARAILQDLLRRETQVLRKFQIEALEQGEILLSSSVVLADEGRVTNPGAAAPPGNGAAVQVMYAALDASREESPGQHAEDLQELENTLVYHTVVFQLEKLRLDGIKSFRGQVRAQQNHGLPRYYPFAQEWSSLFQDHLANEEELGLTPVFISLSPDTSYLLLTVRIYEQLGEDGEIGEVLEDQDTAAAEMQESNYAFATFAVQVY